MLLLAGVVTLVLLMWLSPSIPITLLRGFALALVVSFPVRALSRLMPRGWTIPVSFLTLIGLAILALVFLVPVLIVQLGAFINNVPGYVSDANRLLRSLLEPLSERGLLPGTTEKFVADLSNPRWASGLYLQYSQPRTDPVGSAHLRIVLHVDARDSGYGDFIGGEIKFISRDYKERELWRRYRFSR